MDFYRFPAISMPTPTPMPTPMPMCGFLWTSMDFYGVLKISIDFYGFLKISMDFYGKNVHVGALSHNIDHLVITITDVYV